MKSIVLAALLSAVIGCRATESAPEDPEAPETPEENSQGGPSALEQFEALLLEQLDRGNWIAERRNIRRICEPAEESSSCSSQLLVFADGTRLSIDSAHIGTSILDFVYSNTTVTQEAPRLTRFPSECLRSNIHAAHKHGWRIIFLDWDSTSVHLVYYNPCLQTRSVSFELDYGTCFIDPAIETDPVVEDSQGGPPVMEQFEALLFQQFERGNWIAAVGRQLRDCRPDDTGRICIRSWLRLADGMQLSVDSSGNGGGLESFVFSNFTVTQEAPQLASISSECLQDNMRVARERGWRLTYFDQLFNATTVFLGYNCASRAATFDLANGSCYLSEANPWP